MATPNSDTQLIHGPAADVLTLLIRKLWNGAGRAAMKEALQKRYGDTTPREREIAFVGYATGILDAVITKALVVCDPQSEHHEES